MTRSLSSRAEKVPFVASDIGEDGEAAVRLIARFSDELDTVIEHAPIASVEVIDAEEESDATGELVPNC